MSIVEIATRNHGASKPMGLRSAVLSKPHYFLLRKFLGEVDLLIIFNTPRCRFQCRFCDLPAKNTLKAKAIPKYEIVSQFENTVRVIAPAIDVVDRITLSNEGSVLDADTFPRSELDSILLEIAAWRSLQNVVFESRVEFATDEALDHIGSLIPDKRKHLLFGFESANPDIRDRILGKREPLEFIETGFARLGSSNWSACAYILYKPVAGMSDDEADSDALGSYSYLSALSTAHRVPLTVRLNLMYVAADTAWAKDLDIDTYVPPSLSRALLVAKKIRTSGVPCYLGLSTEGLADPSLTYRARSDFSRQLMKEAIYFNLRSHPDGK